MRLANGTPSLPPVHPQIRAIGPRDLHLAKGRGQSGLRNATNFHPIGEQILPVKKYQLFHD